jgi:gluconolactonase
MRKHTVLARGLRFPKGPVWMRDGSVVLTEIARGTITRVDPDGTVSVLARPGDRPNGLAVGPDGALYCCNSGGFDWLEYDGRLVPTFQSRENRTGRIERIDAVTGTVDVLYESCDGHGLRSPNDIVFDRLGGFYFTDLGKKRSRDRDWGGVYYARADGSHIMCVAYPVLTPNGIGLSPDGQTLYMAETETARLWAFELEAPGVIRKQPHPSPYGGRLVCGLGGFRCFDSLAVQASGNISVATLVTGAITTIATSGQIVRQVTMGDPYTTNICFGGDDMCTAYVTLSGIGELVQLAWPEPGLRLFEHLRHAGNSHAEQHEAQPSRDKRERLESFIRARLKAPIALDDLAAAAGVSRTQLNRLCQEEFDCSPMTLVRRMRLEAARFDLERNPDQDFTNLSLRYGFEHQSRFAQYYRTTFGELPRETRRRLLG